MNGTPAWKGGAKRLKALLKATIGIVSFVFQESTPCFVDHRLKSSSSVTVRESPHRGFRRIHPAFPTLYFSSTMKATVVALIFVLIGWAILFPQPAAGHGIHYDVQQQGFSVRIFYSAQDAASYSEYELYGPGDTIPHQTGRTDKNGYVSFFPDRAGAWKVKVLGESTHGFHGVTIDVNIDKGLNLESFSKPLVARSTKLITGVSLIIGIFGIYALLKSRRRERHEGVPSATDNITKGG